MASIPAIALSGMQAAQTQMNVAAHNVANMSTEGFKRQKVELTPQSQGGVASTVSTSDVADPRQRPTW